MKLKYLPLLLSIVLLSSCSLLPEKAVTDELSPDLYPQTNEEIYQESVDDQTPPLESLNGLTPDQLLDQLDSIEDVDLNSDLQQIEE